MISPYITQASIQAHQHTAVIQPAHRWHTAGTQLAHSWHTAGTPLAHRRHTAGTQLARSWHQAGTHLSHCRHSAGTQLAHSGTQLAPSWRTAGNQLAHSWHTAGTQWHPCLHPPTMGAVKNRDENSGAELPLARLPPGAAPAPPLGDSVEHSATRSHASAVQRRKLKLTAQFEISSTYFSSKR